ncbi:unnamed protein product [Durusdinium trenchii]|uniref:EF-hand domain-containing protein n=1 Tax=Durusdinium trenchii TaxID=1381693 RepID=A0ABP0IAT9_9DINO
MRRFVPLPPGRRDIRSKGSSNARARMMGAKQPPNTKCKPSRPRVSRHTDIGSDTTSSDVDGCQRSTLATDHEPATGKVSDAEYEIFVSEGARMPDIPPADKFVSCRPAPGGVYLILQREPRRCLDVQGTLEELEEEVPEVDEDGPEEGPWSSAKPGWRPIAAGTRPSRQRPVAPHGRVRGEFGNTAWPYGPRRVSLERPHSAQYAKEVPHQNSHPNQRPSSARAALTTAYRPGSARATPLRPSSAASSVRSGSTRPASAQPDPAQPASARPASARPASARPASARPASARPARPASARPASARPASARRAASARRPASARPASTPPGHVKQRPAQRPASAPPMHAPLYSQEARRPQSAPAFRERQSQGFSQMLSTEYSKAMGSVLFQQQDFLDKRAADTSKSAHSQCRTTLMHNWLIAYQKSRLRARMACRPLFGEGSDAKFTFPKTYAPAPPPLTKRKERKERDLEEEIRQIEIALGGPVTREASKASACAEDEDVRPVDTAKSAETTAVGRRGSLLLPIDKGGGLDLTGTIGKKMSLASQSEPKVQPVRTLPFDTPRGAMTPGASTVFNQMSMREPSVGGGTEGTSVSGLDFSEASDFLPTVGMMPKKEMLHKVFHRLADDGEVHKDVLSQSLELLGIRHIKQPWIEKILLSVTRYTTLSLDEYMNFVHAYMDLQSKEYESAFYQLDKDGSGTIEAGELSELLLSIGITPMDHVINELSEEFDVDHSGDMNLEEFCRLLAVINEREGFSKVEYDRFKHAFEIFADEFGCLNTGALFGILGYLGYEMSPEVVTNLVRTVDVDGSGTLSFPEFIFFMRKVREQEVMRLEDELGRLELISRSDKEELLTSLLRVLGYVPDQEAIRDAACDSNINLGKGQTIGGRRNSAQTISLSLVNVDAPTKSQKQLSLSEAYRFLEVYRLREGFTRAEADELKVFFEKFGHESDNMSRISSCDAGRALSWLGYKTSYEEHELLFAEVDIAGTGDISLPEFLKLVRKYRQKELEQIRASYLKMGMVGKDTSADGQHVMKQSMTFLGLRAPTSSMTMTVSRSRTDFKSLAQKMKDAEDARYGILRTAVTKRNQMRVLAQQHFGFSVEEVEVLRRRFQEYDSDGSGTVHSSELRTLCQELVPELSLDPKCRPEILKLLREANAGDGRMSLNEFLGMARQLEDSSRRAKARKEQVALDHLSFTHAQVRDFREIFVEHDDEHRDHLSFQSVVSLLGSLVPLGDRRVQQLAQLWQKNVEKAPTTSDTEEWAIDFPDFMRLMHAVLEIDFCGIKVKSTQIANELEEAKKRSSKARLQDLSTLGRLSTLSASSNSEASDALMPLLDATDPD